MLKKNFALKVSEIEVNIKTCHITCSMSYYFNPNGFNIMSMILSH